MNYNDVEQLTFLAINIQAFSFNYMYTYLHYSKVQLACLNHFVIFLCTNGPQESSIKTKHNKIWKEYQKVKTFSALTAMASPKCLEQLLM